LTAVLGETQERLEGETGRRRVTSVRTAGSERGGDRSVTAVSSPPSKPWTTPLNSNVNQTRTAGTITKHATGTVRKKRASVLNARKISTASGMAQRLAVLALNITQTVSYAKCLNG